MPSLTLSEMVAIVLVILIVFGPQRLPEMARKTALLIRRARSTLASVRDEFESEYSEFSGPLKEVRDEVAGVRRDLSDSVAAISEDIKKVKEQQAADAAASAGDPASPDAAGPAAGADGNDVTPDDPEVS